MTFGAPTLWGVKWFQGFPGIQRVFPQACAILKHPPERGPLLRVTKAGWDGGVLWP